MSECGLQPSDSDLVRSVRSGSTDAFDVLVTRYRANIYRLACAITQCHDAADDLSQEAFVRAFRKIDQCDPDRFLPWLRKILVNLCVRSIKNNRTMQLSVVAPAPAACDPRENAEASVIRRQVRDAISALDPSERVVIVLHYLEGLKQTEVAEALNCPVGTVWSRLNSARKHLRQCLEGLI